MFAGVLEDEFSDEVKGIAFVIGWKILTGYLLISSAFCSAFATRQYPQRHYVFGLSVRSSGQILLPGYLMNGLSSLNSEYSIALHW